MQFTVSQSLLAANLALVSRVVPSRPSQPILANILLKADRASNTIALTGFDLSIGLTARISAQVEEEGSIALPAKLLLYIVSRLPDGDILATVKDGLAGLKCQVGKYQIRGMDADSYPELPSPYEDEPPISIALPSASLLQGLDATIFAASTDETKQVLTGVRMSIEEDAIEFASTDGHILSVLNLDGVEVASRENVALTMPVKSLSHFQRMVDLSGAKDVSIEVQPTHITIECGDYTASSRVLEGQYPNYQQLIPKQFARQATINRRLLMSALERVAVMANQKAGIIKLSFSGQELVVSCSAVDVGNAQESIAISYSGDAIDIAFNVKYLLDGLKSMNASEVLLSMNKPTSPAIVTPLGGAKHTFLLMPVQLKG